jgi:hypothetical protein
MVKAFVLFVLLLLLHLCGKMLSNVITRDPDRGATR